MHYCSQKPSSAAPECVALSERQSVGLLHVGKRVAAGKADVRRWRRSRGFGSSASLSDSLFLAFIVLRYACQKQLSLLALPSPPHHQLPIQRCASWAFVGTQTHRFRPSNTPHPPQKALQRSWVRACHRKSARLTFRLPVQVERI